MHFQPGEGPNRGLLRDCENRWIDCSPRHNSGHASRGDAAILRPLPRHHSHAHFRWGRVVKLSLQLVQLVHVKLPPTAAWVILLSTDRNLEKEITHCIARKTGGTGDSARLLRETAGLTADPESDEIIENVSYRPELRRASGRPDTRIGIEFKISH